MFCRWWQRKFYPNSFQMAEHILHAQNGELPVPNQLVLGHYQRRTYEHVGFPPKWFCQGAMMMDPYKKIPVPTNATITKIRIILPTTSAM